MGDKDDAGAPSLADEVPVKFDESGASDIGGEDLNQSVVPNSGEPELIEEQPPQKEKSPQPAEDQLVNDSQTYSWTLEPEEPHAPSDDGIDVRGDDEMPELDRADDPLTRPVTPASPLPTEPTKKSKKWLLAVLVIIAVLAVGTGTYGLMGIIAPVGEQQGQTQDDTSAAQTDVDQTESESVAIDSDVAGAIEVFDSAAEDEASTLNTDDSNLATEASSDAGTVGDSIDEDNF